MKIWLTVLLIFVFFPGNECEFHCEDCKDDVCGSIRGGTITIADETTEIPKEVMLLLNDNKNLTCMFFGKSLLVQHHNCKYIVFEIAEGEASYGIMPHDDNWKIPICFNKRFNTVEYVYPNRTVAVYGPGHVLVYEYNGESWCRNLASKKTRNSCKTTREIAGDNDEKPRMLNSKFSNQHNQTDENSVEEKSESQSVLSDILSSYGWWIAIVLSIILIASVCCYIKKGRYSRKSKSTTVPNTSITEHEQYRHHSSLSINNSSHAPRSSFANATINSGSASPLFNPMRA